MTVSDIGDSDEDSIFMSFQYHYEKIAKGTGYSDNAILIDTGSNVSVFKTDKMLMNVQHSNKTLRAITNGGHQDSNMKGNFPGFFPVWYNPASMLNILAWTDVRKFFRITADTLVANEINVHISDDFIMKFKELENGLFIFDGHNDSNSDTSTKKPVSCYSFLMLVKANKENFQGAKLKERIRHVLSTGTQECLDTKNSSISLASIITATVQLPSMTPSDHYIFMDRKQPPSKARPYGHHLTQSQIQH